MPVSCPICRKPIRDDEPAFCTRPYTPPEADLFAFARVPILNGINHDEEPHTVTSASGAFASAGLSRDDTFSQRFSKPGTYAYMCALHPHMKATVIVQ